MTGPVESGLVRKRIYLMRHGEVAYFDPEGRPVNPKDVRLTADGEAQARAVGDLLADAAIDRAVCSGLPRGRQTAEIVLGKRDLEILDEPELAEIKGGRFAAVPPEEAVDAIAYPYHGAEADTAWFCGGERFAALETRVLTALDRAMAPPDWQGLLIVGHDAVNRVLLSWAAGAGRRAMAAFEQDYGGLSVIDVDLAEDNGALRRSFIRIANLTPLDPAKAARWQTSMEPIYERYLNARAKGLF